MWPKSLLFVLFWLAASLASDHNSWKMNVPRLLLPLTEEGASFKLFSKGGCFTWKSTRPEVIVISPIYNVVAPDSSKCSASAMVSIKGSLAASLGRTQAVIMAEDFNAPGLIIRTDVIADSIKSLQIVTKTHDLYLEEAPEEFEVRAYDGQGNEFSTLDGILFKWTIQDRQSGNIRFIKFRDSSYALDPVLEEIEAKGQQGSKVLLEGIKSGSAKVSVRLDSKSAYATAVPATEVSVLVVANLYIVPPVAYVIFGGTVNYHAEQIKANKIHIIDIATSSQYYLELEDETLAKIDASSALVTAGSTLGTSSIFLRDKNVELRSDLGELEFKSPTADLHVVQPDHIGIDIDPFKSWIVLVGNTYELSVDIYDAENRKLFPSSNLVVKVDFMQSGYFNVAQTTANGTWVFGTPIKSGTVQVKATLVGTRNANGYIDELAVPLTATAVMEIFEQIDLQPKISVFPWDPTARTMHQVMYTVRGGATPSSFIWSSSNTSLSTVTQNGIAKTRGHLIGETHVTAAMNRAVHNLGTAIIRVAPAISLDIIDDHVREAEVGKKLTVPVAFFAHDNEAFSDCAGFPYDFSLNDLRTFSVVSKGPLVPQESSNQACTTVSLSANDVGFTSVSASYSYASIDNESLEVLLSDEATVAAYSPLTPIQPSSGSALLALGSSFQVVWSGGPQPWIKEPRSHFHKLAIEGDDKSIVTLTQRLQGHPASADRFSFQVLCQKYGTVDLVLTVGNEKSATLPRPVLAQSKVSIKCGEPDKLKLEADVPQPKEKACPLMAKTAGNVAALAYQNLDIVVSVFDATGQKFDNISTFDISWSSNQLDLGSIPAKGIISSPRPHQVLETKSKTGQLEVTAVLKTSGSYLIGGFGSISDTLPINLVTDATITPDQLLIFNHPDNVLSLSIQHGSGFFDLVTLTGGNIVSHKYHVTNQSVAITPLRVGETVLSVRDLCLVTKGPAPTAKVQVVGIKSVELLMLDKVQLGKSVVAQVRLLDQQGRNVPHEQLKYLQVQLAPSTKQIVKLEPKADSAPEDLLFVVEGSQLGLTMVTAEVTYGLKQISSSPMPIQVFPPLVLEPRNITLIIGAKFQVQIVGGPQEQPDSTIEFSIGQPKIALSNNVGLITASTLGSTKLICRVYGTDRTTSRRVVFSEDTVFVHVVKLDGIRIRAPVHIVQTGTELPIFAVGLDGDNQNAYSYGSARPNLYFHWSVSDQEVGQVVSVFHKNGIAQTNSGVARFVAKKSGRVTIKVRVTITTTLDVANQFQLDRDREFQDEIEIKVLDALALRSPPLPNNVVLMSPQSEYQLKTNRDFATGTSVTYSVVKASQDLNASVATVDKNGLLVAGQVPGTCIVHVSVTEGEHAGVVQHTSILVNVKPVKFSMLNVLPSFKPSAGSKPMTSLPKGVTLNMEMSYHDNLALKFHAVHQAGAVSFRPSRFESNQIDQTNTSSTIELVKVTETVLRASHVGGQHDFVIFDVRTAISPNVKKVIVGDVIILQSSVASDSVTSEWISEPSGIISVNNLATSLTQGYAVALRSGQARISLLIGEDRRVTLDLEVESASKISFNKTQLGSGFSLTNIPSQAQLVYLSILPADPTSVQAPGNLHSPHDWNKDSSNDLLIASDLFHCHASFLTPRPEFSKLFLVDSVFVPSEGSYACRFDPISDSAFAGLFMSADVELSVRPTAVLANHNPNIHGDLLQLKFYSAYKMKTSEVVISNLGKRGEVIVQGPEAVLETIIAQVSHPDLFSVGRPVLSSSSDQDDIGLKEMLVIPVGVRSAFWKSAQNANYWIEIQSKKTIQSVRLPIRVVLDDKFVDSMDPSWSMLLGFFLKNYETVMIVVIVAFVTWIYAVKKSSGTAPSTAPAANGSAKKTQAGPASPFLNGTPVAQTPRVDLRNADNRSFLWSVDNSPIYGSPAGQQSQPRRSPRPLAEQYSY